MSVRPLETRLRERAGHRMVATRYPSQGILDRIAEPEDLEAVFELESWTNDRITTDLGILLRIPRDEWVVGTPNASVVMAAFCHPRPGGGRFNDEERGAWYAAFTLDTALTESLYHRGRELAEVGVTDARLEMREYVATFSGTFHDIRSDRREYRPLYHPDSYDASQRFARELLEDGSNGVIYRSVRDAEGLCLACFRPRLVADLRVGGHFEYRWSAGAVSGVRKLRDPNSPA
jgi:RES domain